MGVKGTLEYLDEQGEDVDAILDPESGVTIDGVPNDAEGIDELGSSPPPTVSDVGVKVPDTNDPGELADSIPGIGEYGEEHLPVEPSNTLSNEALASTKEHIERLFERSPPELRRAVVGNMVAIASTQDPARGQSLTLPHQGTGKDGQSIQLPTGNGRTITIHETAHAIHKTFGYKTEDYTSGNISFKQYDVSRNSSGEDAVRRYMLSTPSGEVVGEDNWRNDVVEEVEAFTPGETDASSNAQDIIGTSTGGTVEERMQALVDSVNRAFFKQQVALDQHGKDATREMVQKTGYSTKAASETFTMLHEVMNLNNPAAAIGEVGKLVDHHPQMLNAYLNIYEPSGIVREELERRGVL